MTPQIVWKGLDRSEALEQRILDAVAELSGTYRRIESCRVVVEQPHKHKKSGAHFQVKVEVVVPQKRLTVSRDPRENDSAQDAYAAVNDAFAAMRRQLDDYAQVRRGDVKEHEARGS